jgi:hypothetical protein
MIVNQGTTRGDAYAAATLDAPLGRTLTELVTALPVVDGPVVDGPVVDGPVVDGRAAP